MYDFLRGRLVERGPDEVVLDVGGVGFVLEVSGATAGRLPAAGDETTLYVHDRLRDERFSLYGFASREERELFLKLLTVSRVGPSTALAILSAVEPGALVAAVDGGDVAALARVRGVGKRLAERLCVELKGRLGGLPALPGRLTDRTSAVAAALGALGYPRAAAREAAERVASRLPADAPLESLVKEGLRALSGAAAGAAAAAAPG
jgi:Holliday junction DNA helicase RuvA